MKKSIILSVILGLSLVGIGRAETNTETNTETNASVAPVPAPWWGIAKKKQSITAFRGEVTAVNSNSVSLNLGSLTIGVDRSTAIEHGTNSAAITDITVGRKVRVIARKSGGAYTATLIQLGQQPAK